MWSPLVIISSYILRHFHCSPVHSLERLSWCYEALKIWRHAGTLCCLSAHTLNSVVIALTCAAAVHTPECYLIMYP